ncbi:MAG: hypothetical protein NWF05_02155 [Candidatus Bathyarchaeota archaeon]|nr:hypothetical protein [Candidatus Bathyarchaeota archaeon]
MMKKTSHKHLFHLRPFDLALIGIMSATNFVISLSVAPALKAIIPHVFLGAFLMVPLDIFLAYLVWAVTHKNIFTLYFLIYGLLTAPTTIWGNMPGLFKPFLGIAIGLSLDLLTLKFNPQHKSARYLMGTVFPVVYWSWTAFVWMIAGLPIVQLFQMMMQTTPILNSIIPSGFIATFAALAFLTIPSSVIAVNLAVSLSKRVKKIVPVQVPEEP